MFITNIKLVVDLDHRCVDTCTKTLNLGDSEFSIGSCLAMANALKQKLKAMWLPEAKQQTKILLHSLEDIVCSADHARGRRADLHVVGTRGVPSWISCDGQLGRWQTNRLNMV